MEHHLLVLPFYVCGSRKDCVDKPAKIFVSALALSFAFSQRLMAREQLVLVQFDGNGALGVRSSLLLVEAKIKLWVKLGLIDRRITLCCP